MRALLRLHPAARAVRRPHLIFRPRLEPLEGRWVPAFPVTVNNAGVLPATTFLDGNNIAIASVVFGSGGSPTVVAQPIGSQGTFLGGQIAVASSGVAPNVGAIGAAGDGNGDFLVAWPVSGTAGAGAQAQLFTRVNGTYAPQFTQPPALLVPAPPVLSPTGFARAAMNSQGAFVLAEEITGFTASFSTFDQFEVQEFTNSGQPIGTAPFSFTSPNASFGSSANPVVAIDGAGNYVVVWNDAGQVVFQLFNPDSTPNTHTPTPVPLAGAVSPSAGYSVAMDPAGAFVVGWATSNTSAAPGKVFAQRFDAQGTAIDAAPITVATNIPGGAANAPFQTFTRPQVGITNPEPGTTAPTGGFVVAFDNDFGTSGGPTTHTISAQQFSQSGLPVGGLVTVEPPVFSTPQNPHFFFDAPSLAESPAGSFTVAWDLNASPPLPNNQQGVQTNLFPVASTGPDVTVTKSADQATVNPGQSAGFTVTLTNTGDATASGVTLSDPLPAGAGNDITWVIDTGTGNPADFAINQSGGNQLLTLAAGVNTLAAGQSIRVHVTGATSFADAPAPSFSGTLSNTATVSASNEPAADQNRKATAVVSVVAADMTVLKAADQATVEAGDTAGFTVTVSDAGAGAATGVTLSDPLPAGAGNDINWQIDPATGNAADFVITGAVGSQVLTLAPGVTSLTPGQALVVHITGLTSFADAPAPALSATLTNTATVSAANEAPANQNQQFTATVTVVTPDVTVAKSADQGSLIAGQSAGFTVTITNAGAGTATGVTLTDLLPAGAGNDINWQIDLTTGTPSDFVITGTVGSQDLGLVPGVSLPAGIALTVHVTGLTTAADAPPPSLRATLHNTATVSAGNEGAGFQNQRASASIDLAVPDIHVTKTADQPQVIAGQGAGFTVAVSDVGTAAVAGVVLSDPLPAGAGGDVSWVIDMATGNPSDFVISGAPGSQVLALAPGVSTLNAGQVLTVHITGVTTPLDAPAPTFVGQLANTATLTATGEPAVQASSTIIVLAPHLTVRKTADQGTIDAGQTVGFTVRITDDGTAAANGMLLNDPLPAGAGDDISWAIDPGTGNAADFVISGPVGSQVLTLAPGVTGLTAGQSLAVHITGLTSFADAPAPPLSATLTNTATVSAANVPPDVQSEQSTATVTLVTPDVTVAKSADAGLVGAGAPVGFTVTITNAGAGTATGVTLSDLLPAGDGNDINWQIDPGTGTPAAFVLTGPVGSQNLSLVPGTTLAAGGVLSVHVTGVTTAADAPPPTLLATLHNTATVSAGNEGAGFQNQHASASIGLAAPDIHVTKFADQPLIDAGQEAGFTVIVSNVGTNTATGVALNDPLPGGAAGDVSWAIDPTTGDPINFAVTGPAGQEVLSFAEAARKLDPGQSLTVHIVSSPTSLADAPAPSFVGQLANTATVTADNEPAVQASSTVTVLAPHLTLRKTADQGTVEAGRVAGFTVTITDNGTAPATGVALSDFIDPGFAGDINWQIDLAAGNPAVFAISGPVGNQNLTLAPGVTTLAAGQSLSVHITGLTSFGDARFFHSDFGTGFLENTAFVTANGPLSASDTANVTIVTPNVTVSKSADRSNVTAGQTAGFTVTVSNVGASKATGVTLSDPLPAGDGADVNWVIDSGTGDPADFVISGGVGRQSLTLAPGVTTLGAGDDLRAHVTGLTTAADAPSSSPSGGNTFIGVLPNTATVSAANEAPVLQNARASSLVFVERIIVSPLIESPRDLVSSSPGQSSSSSSSSSSANAPFLVTALRPTAGGAGNGALVLPFGLATSLSPAGLVPLTTVPPGAIPAAVETATVAANLAGGGSVPRVGDISGAIFLDRNGNGIRDPGEPGVAGQTVFIDMHGDGVFHLGDPYTVTNARGEYVFQNLPINRTYQVRPVKQQYMVQTYPQKDAAHVVQLSDDHPTETDVTFGTVPFRPAAPPVRPVGDSGEPMAPQPAPPPADPGQSGRDQSRNDAAFGEGSFWRPAALPLALVGFFALRFDRRRRTTGRGFRPPSA
jgi:uncharacterized repeat protein (TIGR01451 family)